MKILIRYILLINTVFMFISCSTSTQTQRDVTAEKAGKKKVNTDLTNERKNRALEHFINGCILEQNNELEKAVIEYQDALSDDEQAGIYFALGNAYFKLRKFSLSAINLRKAVELDSSNKDYKFQLAELYRITNQIDEASKIYEEILKSDSSDVQVYYELARIYSSTKPQQALELYNKLLKLVGDDWNIYYQMVELYNRLGDYSNSAKTIENMLFIDPGNSFLKSILAETYINLKEFDKAEKLLRDITFEHPDDLSTREFLGKIYLEKGEWEKASKEFEVLLKDDSLDIDTKLRIGTIYLEKSFNDTTLLSTVKSMFQEMQKTSDDWRVNLYLSAVCLLGRDSSLASSYLNQINNLREYNVELWMQLGGLFFDKRKYKEALIIATKANEIFPNQFSIYFLLGISYMQLENYDEAIKYLRLAVNINQKDINALSSLGYSLGKQHKYDEAIALLQQAFSIEPKNLNVLSTLGMLLDDSGRFAECDSLYFVALNYYPDNPLLLNNYAYSLAERRERLDEALKMSQKAIELDSLNDSYLDTYGWIFYQLGDYETAKKYVLKSIELGSNSAEVLEHLGDIYFKLGEKELAVEYWNKAFNRDKSRIQLEKKIKTGTL